MNKLIRYVTCLIFFQSILCIQIIASHKQQIASFLEQYNPDRGITVLEIGVDTCKYSNILSKRFNATCVMLYLGRLHDEKQFAIEQDYPNVVMANPVTMTLKNLETLVRCEHFDVVIVHGIPAGLKRGHELTNNFDQTLELLLQLGDHTFIEIGADKASKKIAQERNLTLYNKDDKTHLLYKHTEKKGLDIARWNCSHMNWQKQIYRYPIFSNFEKKHYQKKETADEEIPWLKGINLSTFVMLRGICPSEKTILESLEAMRKIKHNDLIIGNMIVQGTKIIPIDLDDPRWNGNVNKCITAALTVFDSNNTRLKNPELTLRSYREYLTRMNKRRS